MISKLNEHKDIRICIRDKLLYTRILNIIFMNISIEHG